MGKNKKLILIDAHALIHRAYHALPPTMRAPDGTPTNAIYGFTTVLIRVLKELKPDFAAAAFDTPEPTFRHKEYGEYKAHRPETASDLAEQFPKVKEVLGALEMRVFENPGFEADDIIGTLARKFSAELEVIIVTGDLDTLQEVGPKVKVYTLKKGVTDTVIYDEKAVKERFGIGPAQITDFKGLKGDPSDNIPGVAGVGEKTASDLLKNFGSLEELYQALEKDKADIRPSLKEKLLANKDQAFFSRKLAVIKGDVPLKATLKMLALKPLNYSKIEEVFRRFGFFSILSRLADLPQAKDRGEDKEDLKTREQTVKKLEGAEFLTGVRELVLEKFDDQKGLYLSSAQEEVFSVAKEDLPRIKKILESEDVKKTGYDLKGIFKMLKRNDINMGGINFDVMIAAYILYPGRRDYEFEKIAFGELGQPPIMAGAADRLSQIWQLKEKLLERLKENEVEGVFKEIEVPLISVLAGMELLGIKLNGDFLKQLSEKSQKEIKILKEKIFKLAGEEFNISSPKQLSQILFEKLGFETKGLRKTAGGAVSTRAGQLEKLKGQNEIIDLILDYRELIKLQTTYLDALPLLLTKGGRLHTTFKQTGTATGRLSSENPNLQNIPARGELARAVRAAFVAERGFVLASFDYSQIELRVASSIAEDKKMMKAFEADEDIHNRTASEIFNVPMEEVNAEMRRQAKVLNFGVLYGMGTQGFMAAAGVSKERAKKFIDEYFRDFYGIAQYVRDIKEEARQNGFVKTLSGRRRLLPEIHSENQMIRAQAERMAINMPVQGTAADIMKFAMIKVSNWLKKNNLENNARMILQVHDELLFEIKSAEQGAIVPKIREIMESAMKLAVPLKVDVKAGPNWSGLDALT
jgi:DNA polymerase-1